MAATKKKTSKKSTGKSASKKRVTRSRTGKKAAKKKVAKKKVAKRKVARKKPAKKTGSKKTGARSTVGRGPARPVAGMPMLSRTFETDIRRQLQEMREHVENMFGHYFPDMPRLGEESKHSWDLTAGPGQSLEVPELKILESEDGFEMTMELPKFNREDLAVGIHNGMLSISGSKQERKKKKDKDVVAEKHRQEQFTRSLRLPKDAETKKIKAKLKKGVLRIQIPRTGAGKKKQHKVKVK